MTPTVRDFLCTFSLDFAFSISRLFFALRVFLRGTFYAVLLEEMEIISRAESFDCVTAELEVVGLLTARRYRFDEFDTSVICHAVLILRLGSFLLQELF